MKTSSTLANSLARSFSHRASLVAAFIGVWALVLFQPVFAQADDGSTLEISSPGAESSAIPPVESVDATTSFEEPWDAPPSSVRAPALAPAQEEFVASAPTTMFVPEPPRLDE
jgi:hypothetical protein